MHYLTLPSLKRRLLKPCKKMVQLLFKLRLQKPLSIKSLHFRRRKSRFSEMMSAFRPGSDKPEMDRVTELTSFSDATCQQAPHPSPLTPAYIRMRVEAVDHVEDACRSFEKYLKEMIVDERKMRDLGDVEELLYCWTQLRSPVFVDLVCRFYRELCTDLFSNHRY